MRSNRKLQGAVFCLFICCQFFYAPNLYALPEFLLRFSQDPFSRAEFRGQCSTCHVDPQGGGPRNPFGSAFEKNDHLVTPEFRQAWPSHFVSSVAADPVPAGGGELQATFLASEQETILEINGEHFRLNTKEAKLEKITPEMAAGLIAAPPAPAATAPEVKLPLRAQPTFDHYLVNLPTNVPHERGSLSMRFTHRFAQPVFDSGIGDLYGLDSFSFSSLGGEVGITSSLTAIVYRSPLDKTIEMGGAFQLLRQGGNKPLSASVRVTVEGRNNFQDFYTTNLVFPVSHAIANLAEVFVVPLVSFNANPFASFATQFDPEGQSRSHTAAVGLGASIRFRPRSAFVVEWMPRVAGFRGRFSRNAYSFGIQRSTNRHVFELVLTNSLGTTTSRAVTDGIRDFTLGFNIYRRLR
ncbi:MAG: DUF5777 family beta-barrel protein [Acidobacteria bacterium]|nr:DUF5777 family beta-barrel protein [Acidobacteriota bacterium]